MGRGKGKRRGREHIISIGNNICKDLEAGESLRNKQHGWSAERRGRRVEDEVVVGLH